MPQVYIFTDRWFFKVMSRKELEQQVSGIRMSAVDSANGLENAGAGDKEVAANGPAPSSKSLCLQQGLTMPHLDG